MSEDDPWAGYLDEVAERGRHRAPRTRRRVPGLVKVCAMWALAYAVIYAVAAITLALHPIVYTFYTPRDHPSPTAQVTHAAHRH